MEYIPRQLSMLSLIIVIALWIFFGGFLILMFFTPSDSKCLPLMTLALEWVDKAEDGNIEASSIADNYIKLYQVCASGNQPDLTRYMLRSRYKDEPIDMKLYWKQSDPIKQ